MHFRWSRALFHLCNSATSSCVVEHPLEPQTAWDQTKAGTCVKSIFQREIRAIWTELASVKLDANQTVCF